MDIFEAPFIHFSFYSDQAELIVKSAILKIPSDQPKRTGGCLALCSPLNGSTGAILIGEVEEEKKGIYLFNALEKVARLYSNKGFRSFETDNEAKGQYGGGLLYVAEKAPKESLIFSFSGLPPQYDEAVSLIYASYNHLRDQCKFYEKVDPKLIRKDVMKRRKHFTDNEVILPVLKEYLSQYSD